MVKSLAASQKLMKNYLSELLTEEVAQEQKKRPEFKPVSPVQNKVVEKERLEELLKRVEVNEEKDNGLSKPLSRKNSSELEQTFKPPSEPAIVVKSNTIIDEQVLSDEESKRNSKKERSYRQGSFQAMFFEVAGLIIAVPLIELGGIHNLEKTNSLMGKPDWFKGVMLHREEQINVVDTALWVMPEKCDEKLRESLSYMYTIMLSDSKWGLTAEKLVDTVTLNQDDVKWLDEPSKRPWLAGLVKDRMCALLDVESLIKLLNDGFNVNNK